jgi:hypothetical protein
MKGQVELENVIFYIQQQIIYVRFTVPKVKLFEKIMNEGGGIAHELKKSINLKFYSVHACQLLYCSF